MLLRPVYMPEFPDKLFIIGWNENEIFLTKKVKNCRRILLSVSNQLNNIHLCDVGKQLLKREENETEKLQLGGYLKKMMSLKRRNQISQSIIIYDLHVQKQLMQPEKLQVQLTPKQKELRKSFQDKNITEILY